MNLAEREKGPLKGIIERGEPLPPKYRLMLFADALEVEWAWQGKAPDVTSSVPPFQLIEHVDEPRADGRQAGGWSTKAVEVGG